MAIRIFQRLELWSIFHEHQIRTRRRKPVRVRAKADNGSVWMVLPERLAKKLKLKLGDPVLVRYADGRRDWKRMAVGLRVRVPGMVGRLITTDAIIEPNRKTVLLGCEEMERMELVADHKAGVLRPRRGTENGITGEVE